jgi:hypothetical protein
MIIVWFVEKVTILLIYVYYVLVYYVLGLQIDARQTKHLLLYIKLKIKTKIVYFNFLLKYCSF